MSQTTSIKVTGTKKATTVHLINPIPAIIGKAQLTTDAIGVNIIHGNETTFIPWTNVSHLTEWRAY